VIRMAKKLTKSQMKRALQRMEGKIFEIARSCDDISYQDAVQLEKLTRKFYNRLK